jgi:hypothetical protein
MQLFVRTLSGRTAVVQAAADEPLAALKARVPLGAPASLVRLAHSGPALDDSATLGELSLRSEATLHASMRLRGGAPTHVKLITQRFAETSVVVRARCVPAAPAQQLKRTTHRCRLRWRRATAPPPSSSACSRPRACRLRR